MINFFLTVRNRYPLIFALLTLGVPVLVGLFIFFTPFPYTTSQNQICFYSALGIALFLVITRHVVPDLKTPLIYPFAFFFLWSGLSLLWALNFENSLHDILTHLLNALILYLMVITFFKSRARLDVLKWLLVASAVIFSCVGLVYYYGVMASPIGEIRLGGLLADGRHVSTELPGNMIGTLLIPALIFCSHFYRQYEQPRHKLFVILCAVIIFSAMVLTQSRGTLAAFFIAAVALLIIKNKKLLPLFLLGMVLALVFSPVRSRTDLVNNFIERIKINYVMLNVIRDYPLTGIGFGMRTVSDTLDLPKYVGALPENYRPEQIITPHNLLIDVAVRLGLIGLGLFVWILFTFAGMVWVMIRRTRDPALRRCVIDVGIALVAYFIIGLAEPVFLFSASAMYFYILAAMLS
ncbi:MAG: O-antigen ligase family protein, partial [Deltaproteobacteria bacterium]|nr:O-antigen ligase family protein [Deltaproteobacteria bacterium]